MPADKEFGEASCTIGGKEYVVRCGTKELFLAAEAIATEENKTPGAYEVFNAWWAGKGITKRQEMLIHKAILSRHHPDLTEDEIYSLMDAKNRAGKSPLGVAELESFKASLPGVRKVFEEAEKVEESAPKAPLTATPETVQAAG